MIKGSECFETQRLVLRRPTFADAAQIFSRYASDADVTRYMSWRRHESIDDTTAFIEFSDAEWARSPAGPYLIESRAGRVLLGATGYSFQSPTEAMVGYVLAREAWGHGYATEALAAVMSLAATISLHRAYALCHVDHVRSHRVLEKCGFERDPRPGQTLAFPNLDASGPQPTVCFAKKVHAEPTST